jgi:hypothetical protein
MFLYSTFCFVQIKVKERKKLDVMHHFNTKQKELLLIHFLLIYLTIAYKISLISLMNVRSTFNKKDT